MSYQDHNGGYPPPRENESQYPPPPGEEDDRRAYHQRNPSAGANNITLPSIAAQYDPQYQSPNGYSPDPRGYGPQDPYRSQQPPPPGQYRDDRQYPAEYGRGGMANGQHVGQHIPGPGQHMNGGGPGQHMTFNQSAPRQRTAIACRYCRRRKIRCSGFDQNPEGRCTNCQRFQQDCIFTPVSSQAQAFVPAHALYPNMRPMGMDGRPAPQGGQGYPQGTQLYGAHGQPLAPGSYPSPGPNQQGPTHHVMAAQNHPGGSPYSDYSQTQQPTQPSPTNSYGSWGADDRDRSAQPQDNSRKRPQPDGHQQILPPPVPGQPGYPQAEGAHRRPAVQDELRLPPVTPTSGPQATSNYSPGSSHSSHSTLQPSQAQSGLPSRTPPPRGSPGDSSRVDKMSLGSIMGAGPGGDIDSSMKGRLNRKG